MSVGVVRNSHLAVPYGERAAAKAAKSWFAGVNADKSRLQRWLPEKVAGQQRPAMSPRVLSEFFTPREADQATERVTH